MTACGKFWDFIYDAIQPYSLRDAQLKITLCLSDFICCDYLCSDSVVDTT